MIARTRRFKFSGMIAPHDELHRTTQAQDPEAAPDEHQIAPTTVSVTIKSPPPTRVIGVPQYAATVRGASARYNPAADCGGAFMSAKFQPNNNCYAYGCNIASNTFPQPGRYSGYLLTAEGLNGETVSSYAAQDGLAFAGKTMAEVTAFIAQRKAAKGTLDGHFVALMISPPGDANWPGDYHWARCDDGEELRSWSQKDGGDQVTNFDFAGNPIKDPAQANWTVNQGPVQPDKSQPGYNPNDLIVSYGFYCYMFVPDAGVNIV